MKHKRVPEDFRVEELTEVVPAAGPFALYRLTKRWLGTPEAIDILLRQWRLARDRVSYGGLKDFHGVTQQYLTIYHGPRRGLQSDRFQLEYVGQSARPFGSSDVTGNRFQVVLRDLPPESVTAIVEEQEHVARDGVPNYFDDQRFGSVGESGDFIGRAWCRGDYERALWLALADPNQHDTPAEREQKRRLRANWGRWAICHEQLERSPRRQIVSFLAKRPIDFRGAVARLRVDLRTLYVAAFQSHLWNRLLDRLVRTVCSREHVLELPLRFGPVAVPVGLDAEQRARLEATELPLPSARQKLEPGLTAELLTQLLGEFGLEQRQLRIKYPRDTFFSKGCRPALFRPQFRDSADAPDDLYPGRRKLLLTFDLPRGCYATILLKRLSAPGLVFSRQDAKTPRSKA
jgi:tRNA pseudouridine13 synthase